MVKDKRFIRGHFLIVLHFSKKMMSKKKEDLEEKISLDLNLKKLPDGDVDVKIHEKIKDIDEDVRYHEKVNNDSEFLGEILGVLPGKDSIRMSLEGKSVSELFAIAEKVHVLKHQITAKNKDYQKHIYHGGIYSENGDLCAETYIRNKLGLHARSSAEFVNISNKYRGRIKKISVYKNGDEADGFSIMSLLTLSAEKGSRVKITATNTPYSFDFLKEALELINKKFHEE